MHSHTHTLTYTHTLLHARTHALSHIRLNISNVLTVFLHLSWSSSSF
jgi:hypothetical protein